MAFLKATDSSALYLSVLTIGELRKGIAMQAAHRSEPRQKPGRLGGGLEFGFTDRILPSTRRRRGSGATGAGDRPRPVIDTLLAATAVKHALTFVTRNMRDVAGIPVKVHSPWTA